jgi:hypothetical protein
MIPFYCRWCVTKLDEKGLPVGVAGIANSWHRQHTFPDGSVLIEAWIEHGRLQEFNKAGASIIPSLTAPASSAPKGLHDALAQHGLSAAANQNCEDILRALSAKLGNKFTVEKMF